MSVINLVSTKPNKQGGVAMTKDGLVKFENINDQLFLKFWSSLQTAAYMIFNSLSASLTEWSNTLKHFVSNSLKV